MRRFPFVPVVVGALLMVSLLLPSCGSAPGAGPSTTSPGVTDTSAGRPGTTLTEGGILLAASPLARVMVPAPRTDVLSAAEAMNDFGADLYRVLAASGGGGNLVLSPASIETALAMTYAGARGETATDMKTVLRFSLEGDALHQAFNSLDSLLESRNWKGKNADGEDEGVVVKTANSLWGQKDLVFEQLFLDTLAESYGAGMRLVDYRTAAEEARQNINEWVAGRTEDRITDLIAPGTLDALTRLVLVNAIYLDATWAAQFAKEATHDRGFTTLSATRVTARMMSQSTPLRYVEGAGWQAVELPYSRDELAMLLIVPDDGRFTEVEGRLESGLIAEAAASLGEAREVALTMPKFQFRTQAGLSEALQSLGMQKAFDPEIADFSGMTAQEALYISDVIHEAYIAVDEEGTEAAAATAVVMRATGMPLEPLELIIDRPFLFALRDIDTGAILFLGRVTDPTA